MPAGKLSVSPLTIHGLDQNGFPNSHTFIGCYVSQSEKQRTNSAPGPQPQFKDTLSYNVTETSETLFLDVINEDPSHPGVIGSGQLSLKSVLDTGRFEDWVPLQSSTGGHLGHLYMKLSFSSSEQEPNPYGVPSPTGTPTPSSDTRDISTLETSGQPAPAYNPNASLSTLETSGVPQPAYNGAASSFSPSTPVAGAPIAGTPPVATEPVKKPKKEVPEWMKYGGAALAGAAAVGLGTWAVNALGSDDEEEQDEEAKQKAQEAQQQQQSMMSEGTYAPPQNAYDQPQESYGSRSFSGPDDAEVARREEEERYEARRREENERYEERRREEEERYEERRREEEAALQEAVDAAEDAADRAEDAAEDAEEAAEEAEEAAEDAEEAAEEAEEAAEEAEEAAEDAEEAAEEAEEAAEEAEEAAEEAEESGSSSDEEEEEDERPNDCKWR
ncbi:hypothetical protein BDF21DRAFT_453015 [Thamnidium elegans]|uniref:C2 domain-containing protein n=1 Tax=Thamnidium elegans TaxID=101142 RepID=A0A8H7SUJ7_9FUNG|nr:hypothetical protein INT48_000159 [Thamnidium elegans]KAI8077542.1 hypothetical protein BDF21DRAFT_453015 [Thamnidium elegans]